MSIPDGAFSSRRETVLGIDIETDHRFCRAAETRVLHHVLASWRTNLVIDVAARATTVESPHHVEIGVRFCPDVDGNPLPEVAAFARSIRARIDDSKFAYRVTMLGAVPGSLTESKGMPVVELTAHNDSDPAVVQAMIEAAVATYRAADSSKRLATI